MVFLQPSDVTEAATLSLSVFVEFCKKLNISVTLSSGYHHSSNPAEHAVKSQISDEAMLGRQYIMANCLAGIPFTPLGPNIPSPSELMGRQFRGILPFFQDHGAAESVKEHVMLQKEKEKCRHDASAHDLPVIPVGATVTYINKDLKTLSIGRVESREGRSYVVATEEGRLVSQN